MNNIQKKCIQELRKYAKYKKYHKRNDSYGICLNISHSCRCLIEDIFPKYYEVIKKWKHFTGSHAFPVPASIKNKTEREAIYTYQTTQNLWNGEYGAMRRKFAEFLAKELPKNL